MEAEKNIFGQYKLYVSPELTTEDNVVIIQILNGIADGIQAELTDEEFIKETSNEQATVQHVVGVVNEYLPETIERVDGKTLTPLLRVVIAERVAIINAK